jgi:hypothetical protein
MCGGCGEHKGAQKKRPANSHLGVAQPPKQPIAGQFLFYIHLHQASIKKREK